MEKVINSIYGVIIYFIFIALLTLGVCFYMKGSSEDNEYTNITGYTYLSSKNCDSLQKKMQ